MRPPQPHLPVRRTPHPDGADLKSHREAMSIRSRRELSDRPLHFVPSTLAYSKSSYTVPTLFLTYGQSYTRPSQPDRHRLKPPIPPPSSHIPHPTRRCKTSSWNGDLCESV